MGEGRSQSRSRVHALSRTVRSGADFMLVAATTPVNDQNQNARFVERDDRERATERNEDGGPPRYQWPTCRPFRDAASSGVYSLQIARSSRERWHVPRPFVSAVHAPAGGEQCERSLFMFIGSFLFFAKIRERERGWTPNCESSAPSAVSQTRSSGTQVLRYSFLALPVMPLRTLIYCSAIADTHTSLITTCVHML